MCELYPYAAPESVGLDAGLTEAIDRMTKTDLEDGLVSCAAIQVICRDKTVYRKNHGFADTGRKIPLSDRHLFRMASMTKPVTAVCTMMQAEAGRLSLEDPVEKYLPAFGHMEVAETDRDGNLTDTHPAPAPITVKDLLTHSSGLGSGPWFGKFCRNPGFADGDTLGSRIGDWAHSYLEFDPATAFSYSGLVGFDVLAHLVEVTSGMAYADFAREKLFRPLGMDDTCFLPDAEQWSRMVQMHETVEKGVIRPVDMGNHVFGDCPLTYHSGGAGLVSCLSDYTRFVHMLCSDGTSGGVRILQAETVRQMRSPQLRPLVPGTDATYSWGLSMRVVLADNGSQRPLRTGAYGWSGAYGTHFWCDPVRQLCAVYCSNMTTAGGSGALTARHLEQAVMDHLGSLAQP
ncbi:MAG: serine hydrolase [Clostridia bacterium]|nr:serine hydrolase [Clostridia bacterium]